jgi:hypothetical protein
MVWFTLVNFLMAGHTDLLVAVSREELQQLWTLRAGDFPEPYQCRQTTFFIPFSYPPPDGDRIDHVLLFVSADKGKSWKVVGEEIPRRRGTAPSPFLTVEPAEGVACGRFSYTAPSDGLYWFKTHAVLKDGSRCPAEMGKYQIGVAVLVDTSGTGE